MIRLVRPVMKQQEGAALFTAMVFLISLTILGITAVMLANIDQKLSQNLVHQKRALWSAEEGVMLGVRLAEVNDVNMTIGSTISLNISQLMGTVPSQAPPLLTRSSAFRDTWTVTILKQGDAPQSQGYSLEASEEGVGFKQYQIHSVGQTASGYSQNVEMLVRTREIESGGSTATGVHRRLAGMY